MTTGPLETNRAQVLEWHLDGVKPAEIARRAGVSRQAASQWLNRQTAQKQEVIQRLDAAVDAVVDNWIAVKSERLAKLTGMYLKCEEALNEYGVMITEERTSGSGESAELITTRRFNGGMIREMRGLLSDAATELGQLPKADQNINLRAQVLIREYTGVDPESIG